MSGIQAAPATGAKLDPAAARLLIARRLTALGHKPDLLDPGAIAALVDHADGSGRRLRTGLAATLFLASTEDAPGIDAALVARALAEPPTPPTAAAGRPAKQPARRRLLLAGSLCAVALASAVLALRPSTAPAPPLPAAQPSPPPTGGLAATPRRAPPPTPSVAPLAPPEPAPSPLLAPLPPPVAIRAPPVPPASHAPPLDATLPADPPAAVLLLFPAARATAALDRLRAVALALQHAGFTDIRAKPTHAPPPRRVISFFYSDDKPLADVIAKTLAGARWPGLAGNLLQPSLVLLPVGLPPRNPGTIEVQLP